MLQNLIQSSASGSNPPDLDPDGGVARLGGNKSLYSQLLRQFLAKYSSIDIEISDAMKQGRSDDAIRLVHTVKGVAGNLNISALYLEASDWERALRAEKALATSSAESNGRFTLVLGGAVRAVEEYLNAQKNASPMRASEVPAPASTPVNNELLKSKLAELRSKLQTQDMSAALIGRELAQVMSGTAAASRVSEMNTSISKLDYPEALKTLAALEAALAASGS